MTIQPWGRYSPSSKVDMISKVYEDDNTTANDLVVRLNKAFGIVCTRNAIIGTYGRSPELREKFPLTGNHSSKPTVTEESRRLNEEARANRQREQAERKAQKQERSKQHSRAKADQTKERSQRRIDFEARQEKIAAKRATITAWEGGHCVGVDLVSLHDGICRWPITMAQPYSFCGIGVSRHRRNQVYCSYHSRLAYDPTYNGAWDDE